ncbi:hypothetical protein BpHYR1_009145 [Brachionus plicatilis]|uniref:Uncharacterized protein n=1 Tax=Brachionus plicatilis TaxID=10195 RepID=A0A3M7RLC0_BRAPC|nr:hypothetical protein BpHYR1_009145 [Brachionus plicatilis]
MFTNFQVGIFMPNTDALQLKIIPFKQDSINMVT